MPTMIGLSSGETSTNVRTGPMETPAFSSPSVSGMVEQAQKGVMLPSSAAMKYPARPERYRPNFSRGMYCRIREIAVLIERKSTTSSRKMKPK